MHAHARMDKPAASRAESSSRERPEPHSSSRDTHGATAPQQAQITATNTHVTRTTTTPVKSTAKSTPNSGVPSSSPRGVLDAGRHTHAHEASYPVPKASTHAVKATINAVRGTHSDELNKFASVVSKDDLRSSCGGVGVGVKKGDVKGGMPMSGRDGDVGDAEVAREELKALRAQLSSVRSQVCMYVCGCVCVCVF